MALEDDLWESLAPEALRGSSGHWTADLGSLPVTSGGHATSEEALIALRDAHRDAMADERYRATVAEIALLPKSVQRAGSAIGNGETMWRIEAAPAAIDALAAAGRIVLGLDVRDYSFDGSFIEVAWSSYDPAGADDVERARSAAAAALSRQDRPGDWIVVTWRPQHLT